MIKQFKDQPCVGVLIELKRKEIFYITFFIKFMFVVEAIYIRKYKSEKYIETEDVKSDKMNQFKLYLYYCNALFVGSYLANIYHNFNWKLLWNELWQPRVNENYM